MNGSDPILPIIDSGRTEFGFSATQCACNECVENCRFIPGYLVPSDIERMKQQLDPKDELHEIEFAEKYLWASQGATVSVAGQIGNIPTLVPQRKADGSCIFLGEDNRCQVHAAAPFGCRFFDVHMSHAEADQRSTEGLRAILADNKQRGEYTQLWKHLHGRDLIAPSAAASRVMRDKTLAGRLPFEMEPYDRLTARFPDALSPLVAVQLGSDGLPPYIPTKHRRHLFDTTDGVRLAISRDDKDPFGKSGGHVVHISGSVEMHTHVWQQLRTVNKKQGPVAARVEFCRLLLSRFERISGYKGRDFSDVVWSEGDVPHWSIPWDKFNAALGGRYTYLYAETKDQNDARRD